MGYTIVILGKGEGNGSDANGGGFLTGGTATYDTFQDANGGPILSVTGGGITVTDSGIQYSLGVGQTACRLTKAGAFGSAIVGCLAYTDFVGTYTDGRHEILAVNADYIDIKLDWTSNNNANSVIVGGAKGTIGVLSLGNGMTVLLPMNSDGSQRTFTQGASSSFSTGAAADRNLLKGCLNDGSEITPIWTNEFLDQSKFPIIQYTGVYVFSLNEYFDIKNVIIKASNTTYAIYSGSNDYNKLENVVMINEGTGRAAYIYRDSILYNCELYCTSADHTAYVLEVDLRTSVKKCKLKSSGTNPAGLIDCVYGNEIKDNILFDLAAGNAILCAPGTFGLNIFNNTFYNITATCVATTSAATVSNQTFIENNLFVNCGTVFVNGYAATADQQVSFRNNCYYNVTTIVDIDTIYGDHTQSATDRGDVTLTSNPLNNPTTDFRLKSTASEIYTLTDPCVGARPLILDIAPPASVIDTDTTQGQAGLYHEATEAEVEKDVTFGPSSSYTGLYDPLTSAVWPDEADTWFGTGAYGPNGNDYTPAMRASDITNCTAANIKDGVTIDNVTGEYDPLSSAIWPDVANVSTVEASWGPTGIEYAGTLNLGLYVLKTGVVSESFVVVGHDNYTGGSAGTYPTTATSKAEQLAEDKAAVDAGKADILDTATILTVVGTFDLDAAEAVAYADGEAAQLIIDQAEVTLKVDSILDSETILTIPGLYHEALTTEVEDGVLFGPSSTYVGTFAGGGGIPVGDIVGAEWVVVGHDNYVGGEAGEYPTNDDLQAQIIVLENQVETKDLEMNDLRQYITSQNRVLTEMAINECTKK